MWVANADRSGSDGIIDLIDVSGDLDGPAISTGPQGNVRYMHVGGTVTRDSAFGGGTPETTTFGPGVKVTVTDDSGTPITITPTPRFTANGTAALTPPSISLLTYPIRYTNGGVVIVNLGLNLSTLLPTDSASTGMDIETGGHGSGSAEIGQITVTAPANAGVPITFDPFNRLYTLGTATNQTIDLTMDGKSRIDVYTIENTAAITYNSITNDTPGEIVNMNLAGNVLPDINLLTAQQIGIATSHTGEAVEGGTVITGLEYPFAQVSVTNTTNPSVINTDVQDQQRNLVHVGDVSEAAARGDWKYFCRQHRRRPRQQRRRCRSRRHL